MTDRSIIVHVQVLVWCLLRKPEIRNFEPIIINNSKIKQYNSS